MNQEEILQRDLKDMKLLMQSLQNFVNENKNIIAIPDNQEDFNFYNLNNQSFANNDPYNYQYQYQNQNQYADSYSFPLSNSNSNNYILQNENNEEETNFHLNNLINQVNYIKFYFFIFLFFYFFIFFKLNFSNII
jgi:hypothetical protein